MHDKFSFFQEHKSQMMSFDNQRNFAEKATTLKVIIETRQLQLIFIEYLQSTFVFSSSKQVEAEKNRQQVRSMTVTINSH
jgi:hypothetical protein